jgi:hypothetical protein
MRNADVLWLFSDSLTVSWILADIVVYCRKSAVECFEV